MTAVGVHGLDALLGGLGVQQDLHAGILAAGDHAVAEAEQRLLVGVDLGEPQLAAQLVGLLHQSDVVAALSGGDSGIHTGHAATHDDQHLRLPWGLGALRQRSSR